jgi:DNA-binding response OmpR family regulator
MIKHTIVYAENDFDDYYLLKSAFEEVREDIELVHVDDGWELLEFLQNIVLPSLYPGLIILEINMNGIGGKETLKILKATTRYAHIPVVMFTSDFNEADRKLFTNYGIEIIKKPSSFEALRKMAKTFGEQCDTRLINAE